LAEGKKIDPKNLIPISTIEPINLLIKLNQALGNSFQLHIQPGTHSSKWKPKPESWYFLENGKITFGIKKGIDVQKYKNACIVINNEMKKLSEQVRGKLLTLIQAEQNAKQFILNINPWQFVNVHKTKKGDVVDLSGGGLHHSWEEDDANIMGNVVYEVQQDVMDPVSTLRSFDQGKIKEDGTIREIQIEKYFEFLDTDEKRNTLITVKNNNQTLFDTPYYSLSLISLSGCKKLESKTSFHHLFVQEGKIEVSEVTVTAQRDAVFSSERTGAATSINIEALQALPSITRRLEDFTRLTPQAKGSSFAGLDNRFNNITVDGSYFNNSFGLQGQPGDRTGVSPISLDAVEQVQVNIAPYDVRQGNFVGAGVNTVTKSGTNEFSGSAYYQFRNQDLVGTKAKDLEFKPGNFNYSQIGLRLGGPIMKDKLFFFFSFENDKYAEPGTTFLANTGGQPATGVTTRVLASELDALSSFLQSKFGYGTGAYQGYDHETPATRFLAKFDYNLDDNNKISLRYTHLDSKTDVLASNSSSLGFLGSKDAAVQQCAFSCPAMYFTCESDNPFSR